MQSLAPGDRSIKEYLVKIYGHIQLQYTLLLKSHWAEIFLHSTSLDAYKDCTPCCIAYSIHLAYSIDLASLQVAPSGMASVKHKFYTIPPGTSREPQSLQISKLQLNAEKIAGYISNSNNDNITTMCHCITFPVYIYSVVEDYIKWHLLYHASSLYTAPLQMDDWKVLQDAKFPKTSKLSDDTMLTCVEYVENFMPLAIARPFVKEFITDPMKVKVKPSCNFY